MTDAERKPLLSERDKKLFLWLLALVVAMKAVTWLGGVLPEPLGGILGAVFLVALAGIGLLAFFGWYDRSEMVAWGEFADACGLTLTVARYLYFRHLGEVTGEYRGRAVTLEHYSSGGRYGHVYSRLRLALERPFAGRLELQREGVGAKLKRLAGTDDIQLHDVAFDPRWEVKCSDPALPAAVIGPETRAALRDLKGWWFEWQGDRAEAMRRDLEMESRTLIAALAALSDVADGIARSGARGGWGGRGVATTPTVSCPSCGGAVAVPEGRRPLNVTCPHCHRWMVVR